MDNEKNKKNAVAGEKEAAAEVTEEKSNSLDELENGPEDHS